MAVEHELSTEVQEAIDELVWDASYSEFGPIRDHEVGIAAVLKIKMTPELELAQNSGLAVKLVKLNDVARLFTEKPYVVVVCAYFWAQASERDKNLSLHKALMQIEIAQEDDSISYKTRKPDVQEFSATMIRFGPTPAVQRFIEVFQSASAEVAQLVSSNQQSASS
jgi:hypothetical protein